MCSFLLLTHLPEVFFHHIRVILSVILLVSPNYCLFPQAADSCGTMHCCFLLGDWSCSSVMPSPGMACISHPEEQQLPPSPTGHSHR